MSSIATKLTLVALFVVNIIVPTPRAFADSLDTASNSGTMPILQASASPLSTTSTLTEAAAIQSVANLLPKTAPVAPSPAPVATAPNQNSAPANNNISIYTVVSGDTVSGIAQNFGISVNTILWANNLRKTSTLKAGQKLTILPINGITHTIVKGDTLQAIANTYHGDVQEIMAYNNMADSNLAVGETIVVPNGEVPPNSEPKSSKLYSSSVTINNSIPNSYYIRPIKAGVRTQGIHGKNAVDLADVCGTSIYASAAGTVTLTKDNGAWNGGYGNYVVISHNNGSQTMYAHMEHPLVSEGDTVAQGQKIGLMGETGEATGCHVHFEIRNGPANPF